MPFPSRFIRPLNAVLFATAVVVVSVPQAYAKIYPQAKKLAPQLRPQGLTARPDPNGLKKAQDQAIKILNAMEDNAATGGPDPRGLLTMAFEFQPGVGPVHQTALAGTLMQMWTEARGLGLFDENHKFTPTITRGADTGKNVVFEYIVPLSVLPDFSRDIANLRLIAPSRARTADDQITERDKAYQAQLNAIIQETNTRAAQNAFLNGPKTNALGQTQEQQLSIWNQEVKKAGEMANQMPMIKLTCRLREMATRSNGGKWAMGAELVNISRHPTEIKVEYVLFGITEEHRRHYVMGEGSQTVKMRSTQVENLLMWTAKNTGHFKPRADDLDGLGPKDPKRKRTEVKYRGAIVRVVHATGEAALWTSDPTILEYAQDPEKLKSLPRLYLDKPTGKSK
ncbi:MAG: hypothetical protein KDK97_02380 [Verrucomicrobiales bacterium]|nr:hypothetical protein [Verrucomicrobiales bacterium]MCP5557419.1 hypothetical protein [Verrucomicrobiaceae bacterium]